MKVKLILSGGMDSTVLLYHLKQQGHTVSAISFNYGQRHARELDCARYIADLRRVGHEVVSVPFLMSGGVLVNSDQPMPHGHYAEESMKATVLPNRNMVMLSIAVNRAIVDGCDAVAYGAHSGDHAIYPDCRADFIKAMSKAIALCDWSDMILLAPFADMHKGEIAVRGKALGVPFEHTWTCYEGGAKPCGKCGSCVERAEALDFAGVSL